MSEEQKRDGDQIDLNAIVAERVCAGQVVYVNGPLDAVQAKLHASMVTQLMVETGKQVVVIHTPNK